MLILSDTELENVIGLAYSNRGPDSIFIHKNKGYKAEAKYIKGQENLGNQILTKD